MSNQELVERRQNARDGLITLLHGNNQHIDNEAADMLSVALARIVAHGDALLIDEQSAQSVEPVAQAPTPAE